LAQDVWYNAACVRACANIDSRRLSKYYLTKQIPETGFSVCDIVSLYCGLGRDKQRHARWYTLVANRDHGRRMLAHKANSHCEKTNDFTIKVSLKKLLKMNGVFNSIL